MGTLNTFSRWRAVVAGVVLIGIVGIATGVMLYGKDEPRGRAVVGALKALPKLGMEKVRGMAVQAAEFHDASAPNDTVLDIGGECVILPPGVVEIECAVSVSLMSTKRAKLKVTVETAGQTLVREFVEKDKKPDAQTTKPAPPADGTLRIYVFDDPFDVPRQARRIQVAVVEVDPDRFLLANLDGKDFYSSLWRQKLPSTETLFNLSPADTQVLIASTLTMSGIRPEEARSRVAAAWDRVNALSAEKRFNEYLQIDLDGIASTNDIDRLAELVLFALHKSAYEGIEAPVRRIANSHGTLYLGYSRGGRYHMFFFDASGRFVWQASLRFPKQPLSDARALEFACRLIGRGSGDTK